MIFDFDGNNSLAAKACNFYDIGLLIPEVMI